MALKQVTIPYLLLFFVFSKAMSQDCGTLDRYMTYKSRKYYYLQQIDSIPFLRDPELFRNVRPEDTAILREVIQKGIRSYDCTDVFCPKGISIKIIDFNQFINLPDDTVVLTRRETRLKREYDKLWEKENSLVVAEEPRESIEKRIMKKKYVKLHEKLLTRNPFLFMMYPVFKYKKYKLIMFDIIGCRRCERVFNYSLCASATN